MEHIYFEAQLCINISNFKGNSNIDILINLCLGTSLLHVANLQWPRGLLSECIRLRTFMPVTPILMKVRTHMSGYIRLFRSSMGQWFDKRQSSEPEHALASCFNVGRRWCALSGPRTEPVSRLMYRCIWSFGSSIRRTSLCAKFHVPSTYLCCMPITIQLGLRSEAACKKSLRAWHASLDAVLVVSAFVAVLSKRILF